MKKPSERGFCADGRATVASILMSFHELFSVSEKSKMCYGSKKNGNSHGVLLPLYGVVRRAVGGRLHLLQHVACGSADETTPLVYQ